MCMLTTATTTSTTSSATNKISTDALLLDCIMLFIKSLKNAASQDGNVVSLYTGTPTDAHFIYPLLVHSLLLDKFHKEYCFNLVI